MLTRWRLLICVCCLMTGRVSAQAIGGAPQTTGSVVELRRALTGQWVGTLEYRDYSEPPTSTKRVKLPTWLTIESAGDDLHFRYVYDDGPTKTVTEDSTVRIEPVPARYLISDGKGKNDESYTIVGLDQLRGGRGTLTMTGPGTENDAAVSVRLTLRIGRNIVEMIRETAEPNKPFTFRHAYTLVRASSPGTK